MEAYLDNSATTKCAKEAVEKMTKVLTEDYGNPSSLHMKGIEAEGYVKEARKIIADTLKVKDKEIFFTSGGTEGNNLALIGGALANKRAGMHIITTPVEHASVDNPIKFLEEQGFEVSYLKVDSDGLISLKELRELITSDTILVSIMHVNNEIGAVQPISEAARIIKDTNPNCLFHVDAIQSYGKFELLPGRWGIDMLTVSGHKIHAPKGSGFIYIREKVKIKPEILGGGQEKGLRSGTENVPAIAGLGVAASLMYTDLQAHRNKLFDLKKVFVERVSKIDGVIINGKTDETSAPHIVSVSVEGVRSEVLLHSLEEKSVYVSAGSACSSNKPAISRTLKAIGIRSDLLDSTVRFSFSIYTSMDEVSYACDMLEEIVPVLQKYTRR